jgi:hypothetical protein
VALVRIERRIRAPGEAPILRVDLTGLGRAPLMVGPNADV